MRSESGGQLGRLLNRSIDLQQQVHIAAAFVVAHT
jgi:hypothetical protein